MVNFVIGLEFFGICLTFIALLLLLNGEGAKEQKLLLIIMCGSLVQSVGYLLELTAPTLEAAVAAVTVENVGSAFVPLCYCWFTYAYCYASPPKKLLGILGAINFLVLPTVFFNWNGLFYQEFQWLSTESGFHYISIAYGPLYGLFMVTRIGIPYALCIHTLVRAIRLRSDRRINRQYKTILFISAKTGQRVDRLFELIDYVSNQASTRITTGMLNDVLADAQTRVQPPTDKGRRLKIYYMTQVGIKPPHYVIFCNDTKLFHFSYQRYLENCIRNTFGLEGTPIKISVRQRGDKEV